MRVSTVAIASVPPVEAPIASTVPGGSAGAASRTGGGGGTHLLGQALPQFSDRVRTAGFGQNFDGAEFQGLKGGKAGRLSQAADDDGRHRVEMHQLFQEGEAIHAGHFDIQRDHVGLEREDFVARDVGVGRGADHLDVALAGQGFAEDSADNRGIVNDQDADSSVGRHVRVSIWMATVSAPLPVSTVHRVSSPNFRWTISSATTSGEPRRNAARLSIRLRTAPQIMLASSSVTSVLCRSVSDSRSSPRKSAATALAAGRAMRIWKYPGGSPSKFTWTVTLSACGGGSGTSPRTSRKNIQSSTSATALDSAV